MQNSNNHQDDEDDDTMLTTEIEMNVQNYQYLHNKIIRLILKLYEQTKNLEELQSLFETKYGVQLEPLMGYRCWQLFYNLLTVIELVRIARYC